MASSKLCPYHGMNATSTLLPSASSPPSVAAPSAMISPACDLLAELHQGPLVDGGVLVGAPELLDPVAVVLVQPRQRRRRPPAAPSAPASTMISSAVTRVTVPAPARDDDRARVPRHLLLQPGAHQRRLREEERHALPLHVRAHERAVGVVVLEERDQRRGDGDQLLRRHVHEVDPVRRQQRVVVALAAQHQLLGEGAVGVEHRVGLGDRVVLLVAGREPADLVGDLAVLDHAVRRLDEARDR